MQDKDFLIGIIGPTASGKTDAALLLAQNYNVEILSADASQTRRGMEIGTAAPTIEQQSFARHHFINFIDPDSDWNIKKFVELAENQARSVCAELWTSGLGCIPLPSKETTLNN